MTNHKGTAVALAAAILVSGGGFATAVSTAAPAQAMEFEQTVEPITGIIISKTSTSIAAYWDLPPVEIADYAVTLYSADGTKLQSQTATVPYASFSNLASGTTYSISVIPRVIDGATGESFTGPESRFSATTDEAPAPVEEAAPTVSVTGLSAVASSPTKLSASWDAATATNGSVTGYTVRLLQGETLLDEKLNYKDTSVSYDVKEKTAYTVVVTAHAASPNGTKQVESESVQAAVTTPEAPVVVEPPVVETPAPVSPVKAVAPAKVKTVGVTSKSFVTAFTPAKGVVGKVKGYVVTVKDGDKTVKTVKTSSPRAVVTKDLKANTKYTVTVQTVAVSKDGKSTDTAEKTTSVTTKKDSPKKQWFKKHR